VTCQGDGNGIIIKALAESAVFVSCDASSPQPDGTVRLCSEGLLGAAAARYECRGDHSLGYSLSDLLDVAQRQATPCRGRIPGINTRHRVVRRSVGREFEEYLGVTVVFSPTPADLLAEMTKKTVPRAQDEGTGA
jgi:hypothetical protein